MNTSRWDNSGFLQLSEVCEFSYLAKILLHRNTILPALETCLRLDTNLKSRKKFLDTITDFGENWKPGDYEYRDENTVLYVALVSFGY